MAQQCTAAFDAIARALGGFTCQHAPAVIHLRNPSTLSNWTLPVLELMMVTGAVLALIHAIRRLRRDGDPTNLALWFATVVYLFVIEIPLYFPNVFGIQDQLGVVFAHNVFTVEFLFDRLPLYIVALYPAVVSLAFEIVRSLGVFRDRGIVVGAICVGFVHHCFYEVFDQLGPHLRWWAWNGANPINHPMLASVPMTSVFIFATLGPIVVTVLVLRLVGNRGITPDVADGAGGRVGPRRYRRLEHPDVAVRRPSSAHGRASRHLLGRVGRDRGDRRADPGPAMAAGIGVAQRICRFLRHDVSGCPRGALDYLARNTEGGRRIRRGVFRDRRVWRLHHVDQSATTAISLPRR